MNAETGAVLLADLQSRGYGDRAVFVAGDVSEESHIEAPTALAESRFGTVDIFFNNAGIAGAIGPIIETEVEHFDATLAVMARGVFLGITHGARAMIKSGRDGSIVNAASIAARSGMGGPFAYSAAKAAVVNMTKNAAVELAQHKIAANLDSIRATDHPIFPRRAEDERLLVDVRSSGVPLRAASAGAWRLPTLKLPRAGGGLLHHRAP